jgi:hypothetical protein
MNILDSIFLPKMERNEFTFGKYERDLKNNKFRDKFNLGICEQGGGTWLMKDFTEEPNALYVGSMGSGKSIAARFSVLTWMLANSDKTLLFVLDTVKGAQDYNMFFGLDQVYEIIGSPEKVHRVMDLIYDEAMARQELFTETGVNGIKDFEKKTGKKMTRCVILMEEFHALPFAIMNFDKEFKNEGSTANKFHTLMRIGRSIGIWFLACTQKSTSSDVPKEVVPNFTQKQIFKVSRGEANYVLGNDSPANLRTDQQGRCFTDYGEVQFPFIDNNLTEKLLDKYVKPCDAISARLTPTMIEDVLAGRSQKEQYKHKPLKELTKRFKSLNSEVVISLLHEAMHCEVEELNSSLDPDNISHIVKWTNGDRTAVMVKNQKRISNKHVIKLIQGIGRLNCDNGILYTSAETVGQTMYKYANENEIELVDYEDLCLLAEQVDNAQKENKYREFKQSQLASDEKESGEYQKKHYKELKVTEDVKEVVEVDEEIAVELEESLTTSVQSNESLESVIPESSVEVELAPNLITEKRNLKQKAQKEDSYLDDSSLDESDFSDDFIEQEGIDSIINNNINNIEDIKSSSSNSIIDDILKESIELQENTKEESRVQDDVDHHMGDIFGRGSKDIINTKKLKRPTIPINFKINAEDSPNILIHCLRNEKNEVYRVLLLTVLHGKEKHKYFIDKQIETNFSYVSKRKLGIKDTKDWNNDPLVNNQREFESTLSRYMENFDSCENQLKFIIWDKDLDFFDFYIKEKKENFASVPIVLENYFDEVLGQKDVNREELIKELSLKIDDKSSIFDEILLDYQAWFLTN